MDKNTLPSQKRKSLAAQLRDCNRSNKFLKKRLREANKRIKKLEGIETKYLDQTVELANMTVINVPARPGGIMLIPRKEDT